jgi:hypothetical protein
MIRKGVHVEVRPMKGAEGKYLVNRVKKESIEKVV